MVSDFTDFIRLIFITEGFPPRWYCGSAWTPELGYFHIFSDLAIFGSYIIISLTVAYFMSKRDDIPFTFIFWLFCSFTVLCGLTHFVDATLFWQPWYRLSSTIKFFTAIVSLLTAYKLIKVIPKVLDLPSLAATRAHLSWIFDSTQDAIITIDLEGKVTAWNGGAEDIFGYHVSEALGKNLSCLLTEESDIKEFKKNISNVLSGKLKGSYEIKRTNKFGKILDLSITASPLFDGTGKILGICSIIKDITEKKKLERDLKDKFKELEIKNKELQSFNYIASHDLKSPLRNFSNLIDWLIEDGMHELNSSSQRHLRLLKDRATRMERLLEDLLIYTKAGSENVLPEEVNCFEMIKEIKEMQLLPEGFQINFPHDLPNMITYKIPLQQIFHNLISNAIKHHHNPTQGIVKISCTIGSECIHFEVKDNGPGIPKAYHERIFKMFETLKPKDQIDGSGAGLAIVKKLLDNFNGEIKVISKEMEGTSFIFKWPYFKSKKVKDMQLEPQPNIKNMM